MNTRTLKSRAVVAMLSAFSTLAATEGDAEACGGAWYPVMEQPAIDHRILGVPRAEDALEEGRIIAAAGRVIRMMPHVKQLQPKRAKLVERAQRVLALAVVRYDGALPLGLEVSKELRGTWAGETSEAREANLAWATQALRNVSALRKADPMSETELAEALATAEATRGEARTILERLASKDLITSPQGYAALAELRRDAGDAQGERLALRRCEQMAKDKGACSARTTG